MDDSKTMRRWLGSMIAADPRLELVGTAASAQEARRIIKETNPDVLTLDVEMPEMDGIEFLSHLMRLRPMPVVMLSGALRKNGEQAKRARALGAAACVQKPTIPTPEALAKLCDSIVAAARQDGSDDQPRWHATDKVILFGASTGGVTALETILPQLPVHGPPVVVAQHMPNGFLDRFIERLDRQLPQSVDFAEPDDRLEAGDIRIAPAIDMQTTLNWHSGAWHVRSFPRGREDRFCPSVDVLFGSAAPWGAQVGAALLTGIGNDGAKGMLMLRRNGARTLAQSERSCAVYGMPAAALAMDAVEEECDVENIGTRLSDLLIQDGQTA
ncbi:chemotaxis protein CheB [uncultured Tateyamaria sp.]|uniref:chemotaxis protein CheB n=1 Tax=uncultured Tateyamaria sp. TaxID=455651 RepID=UPI0026227A3B|nr:chemotaxis protein CheB [uncultured Tateyamaria sp.]